MDRDTVIRWAREIDLELLSGTDYFTGDIDELQQFAALAYAAGAEAEREVIAEAHRIRPRGKSVAPFIVHAVMAEREACARVCEQHAEGGIGGWKHGTPTDCASAIRARTILFKSELVDVTKSSGHPRAWLYTLHMEGGQTSVKASPERFNISVTSPWGRPGIDFDPSFYVTEDPLSIDAKYMDELEVDSHHSDSEWAEEMVIAAQHEQQ